MYISEKARRITDYLIYIYKYRLLDYFLKILVVTTFSVLLSCQNLFDEILSDLYLTWLTLLLYQITNTTTSPEIAFTGDTMSDFITDPDNIDVLRSKILIMEVNTVAIPYI